MLWGNMNSVKSSWHLFLSGGEKLFWAFFIIYFSTTPNQKIISGKVAKYLSMNRLHPQVLSVWEAAIMNKDCPVM